MTASEFLENLKKLKEEDLSQIKGFGPILANNLINFSQSDRLTYLLEKFKKTEGLGVLFDISHSKPTHTSGILSGEVVCITGTFDQPRDEIKTKLLSLGAIVSDTISKKVTILLVGADSGSKVEKAKTFGIRIVESLEELYN